MKKIYSIEGVIFLFTVLIRTAILYLLVIITMRLMGKKQIGQLEPFELAITIMISELAALPMQDTRIPLIHGVIPILTLLLLQTIVSLLQLKSIKMRALINGTPSVLIKNGQLDIKELKSQKFNINDLMEELRIKGYYNIEDIEYAILETSGQISIISKTELDYATKKDMNVKCTQDTLPVTLIIDGKVIYENLKLNKNNINDINDVFIALLDSQGKFYYQKNK